MKTETLSPAQNISADMSIDTLQRVMDEHSRIKTPEWPENPSSDETLALAWRDKLPEDIGRVIMKEFSDNSLESSDEHLKQQETKT